MRSPGHRNPKYVRNGGKKNSKEEANFEAGAVCAGIWFVFLNMSVIECVAQSKDEIPSGVALDVAVE
ncbi:hypothetical protein GMOD_00002539 [Pyrenophora seminiperda CCB06]|uniref:Uncharacterized protein n=1 Tax=Pyrenophora seminiperda CCB06 TaxID=1302712 RepID=A0A3M7M2V8_9PLEO|nr:hypothetical protein GMOD_00002539 [Pyrenophora seminiperda CCB06]